MKEGRREYEQEGFFNSISSNNYLPFTILTIYSINIKEIHLTQQWFRWNQSNGNTQHAILSVPLIFYDDFFICIQNNIKTTFKQVVSDYWQTNFVNGLFILENFIIYLPFFIWIIFFYIFTVFSYSYFI